MILRRTLTRERDGQEVEVPVLVFYNATRPHRGARDSISCGGRTWRSCGPPLEPDEPATVEIEAVFEVLPDGSTGPELEVSNSELDSLEQEIRQDLVDSAMDYPDKD